MIRLSVYAQKKITKVGAVSNAKIKAIEATLFSVFGLRKKKPLSGDKKEHD